MTRLGVGLRPRLLGALLLTATVTLGVAALALLGPLQARLRRDTTSTLTTAALESKPTFDDAVAPGGQLRSKTLDRILHELGRRAGSRVSLVDPTGRVIADTDPVVPNTYDDAFRALKTDKTVHDVKFNRVRVATPIKIRGRRYGLLLRKLLSDDLNSDPVDIDDARARVDRAQEQSHRLAQLASDLLDLSRIDAAVDLRSEPVELSELSRAVMAEFDRRAQDQDSELELVCAGDAS